MLKALVSPAFLAALVALPVAFPPPAQAAVYPVFCQAGVEWTGTDFEYHFQSLVAGGIPPYTVHWDFGDGNTSSDRSPIHAYAHGDFFNVELTITDSGFPASECRDTLSVPVGVIVDPFCTSQADLTWGTAPLTVHFYGMPLFALPTSWEWTFGDGDSYSSTLPSAVHTYQDWGTYQVRLTGHEDMDSYPCLAWNRLGGLRIVALPAGVGAVPTTGPGRGLRLEMAGSNPSAGDARLALELPRPGLVRLRVLDLAGRQVAMLVDEWREAGTHLVTWRGLGNGGREMPAGLYFAVLEFGGERRAARMVRMR